MSEHFSGQSHGFSWTAEAREGILTIKGKGELDLAVANDVRELLMDVVSKGARIVVLDLAALAFVDSSGLRLVVELKHASEGRGSRFLLGRLSGPVRRLLDIAGLSSFFEYLDGEAPDYSYCPVCETELQGNAARCPRCGSAF